ncbi:transposable element Tcb1 transposase [Trichonephila clavipes]|nr:transposable element Tcb1 transposase [Trichonephila clavipes]
MSSRVAAIFKARRSLTRYQNGNTDHRAGHLNGSLSLPINNSREDIYVIRMTLRLFSAKVRDYVTSLKSRIGVVCKKTSVCTNDSETDSQLDTMAAATLDTTSQTGESSMDTIGYTSRSPLVRTEGTLNSVRKISGMLRPVALPFMRAQQNPTFQQDNARPHATDIVRTFLFTKNVLLLPWPLHSPDLISMGNKYDACRREIYRPISKRNRRTTAQQVANQFLAASGKQISRKTVARRLRGGGLYARRPVVCPIDQTAPYCPFAMVS